MADEPGTPFKGGKPSEPPGGPAPGEPGHLGPGITPPGKGGEGDGTVGPSGPVTGPPSQTPGGGGKRFCSQCGKDWPAETKFCTACGTWMDPDAAPKKSLRDKLAEQIRGHEQAMAPSFVAEGPPEKKKKSSRGPIVNAILVIISLVVIFTAVTYVFFRPAAYVYYGSFKKSKGDYEKAAEMYNRAREIAKSGSKWYDRATEKMEEASLDLYAGHLDKMVYDDWTGTVTVDGNGGGKEWKVYYSSSGHVRLEDYPKGRANDRNDSLIIVKDGTAHFFGHVRSWDMEFMNKTPVSGPDPDSRKKSKKKKTLKEIGKFATWFIDVAGDKGGPKGCYAVVANIRKDKNKFYAMTGIGSFDPKMKKGDRVIFYVSKKDKALRRVRIAGAGEDETLGIIDFDIESSSSVPDSAFAITGPIGGRRQTAIRWIAD